MTHHLETSPSWLWQEHILYHCFICNLLLVIIVWNGSICVALFPSEPEFYSKMLLLRLNTQTAMTKPMWEKAPMRHGHNRGNTGHSCFLKVTRSRMLLLAEFVPWWGLIVAFKWSLRKNFDETHYRYKQICKPAWHDAEWVMIHWESILCCE